MTAKLQEILRFARSRYIPVMPDDTKELLYKLAKQHRPKR